MSAGWTHPAFETVARLVAAETGLRDLTSRVDAEHAIRRAMQRAHVTDVARFARQLEDGQVPLDDLINELTVGETYFFRDPQHFDFIRTTVIPDVLARRAPGHALKIWSAGCATGEEAYSLAILLTELGAPGHVLATDVSRASLQRARAGRYRRWSLRNVDPRVVERSFRQRGNEWEIDERFRPRVTFEFQNLARGNSSVVPTGVWDADLVLCRNVLIYFDTEAVEQAATVFARALADGGWLITGPSDPPLCGGPALRPVVTDAGVFYQKVSEGAGLTPVLPALAWTGAPQSTAAIEADRAQMCSPSALPHDAATAVGHLQRLANADGVEPALQAGLQLLERFPLSTELHFLHAVLRLALNQFDEAAAAVRRVLYLDRSIAIGHLMLGTIQRRQGRYDDARRSYLKAQALAASCPAGERLPLANGETAGQVAALAAAEVAGIDARQLTAP
jgi:chemotaxis protein methyltransferase CheR